MGAWAGIKIHRSAELPALKISFRSNESRRDFVPEAMLRTLSPPLPLFDSYGRGASHFRKRTC